MAGQWRIRSASAAAKKARNTLLENALRRPAGVCRVKADNPKKIWRNEPWSSETRVSRKPRVLQGCHNLKMRC